jgi:transcriptional regulator with XRE-family HTH domain
VPVPEDLGGKYRQVRRMRDWTQAYVAEEVSKLIGRTIHQSAISRIETGFTQGVNEEIHQAIRHVLGFNEL